ncbi:MAG: biopolymer transporter ExbD [Myxococcales bacterium]|nr:biopolymer transporter ExbD [Myxococcales bacterium]
MDVMLVLLIIFMVIAPTLAEGADIQLPTIFAVDEQPGDLEPIDVALLKNGGDAGKAAVEPALLETKVRELHAKDPKRRVMLRADTQVNCKASPGDIQDAAGRRFPWRSAAGRQARPSRES